MRGILRRLFGGAPTSPTPQVGERFFLDLACERCGECRPMVPSESAEPAQREAAVPQHPARPVAEFDSQDARSAVPILDGRLFLADDDDGTRYLDKWF